MTEYKTTLDVLEYVLLTSKINRDLLSSIKIESDLLKYLKNNKISTDKTTVTNFKAVIPSIYNLISYINKIDNVLNITEIIKNSSSSSILKLRNVKNFSQTMKNFNSSNFFIMFKLGTDKCIAIKENSNWMAPNKDVPLVKNKINPSNESPFKEFISAIRNFISNNDISNDDIDLSKFRYKPTKEQAEYVFEILYGFKPLKSNNNGLYVAIVEHNPKYFGGLSTPIHQVNTIETDLINMGISKNKPPIVSINIKSIQKNIFNCQLICNNKILKEFKLQYTSEKLQHVE